MKKRIFISACEPSAQLHCANLISAVNAKASSDLEVEWVGLGGDKMAAAGCDLLEDTVEKAAMTYNVLGQIGSYIKRIKRVSAYLKSNKVDLVIVCDSPAFNFHIAKAAKRAGVPVLFYVAPQLWAWAPWRIFKLRRCCDRLACILPFEKEWFSKRGVDITFVGNPLFDDVNTDLKAAYKDYDDFDIRTAKIALLPGSRDAEIETLWKPMQQVALKLQKRLPRCRFTTAAVNDEKLKALQSQQIEGFVCDYVIDDVPSLTQRADLAIVASGSATLQVAAAGCPMVVMYQSSKLLWNLLGRWIVRMRFLSLPNILANKELVPEFMPHFDSIAPIFERCNALISDKNRLRRTSRELLELIEPMTKTNSANAVADMVMEMLG